MSERLIYQQVSEDGILFRIFEKYDVQRHVFYFRFEVCVYKSFKATSGNPKEIKISNDDVWRAIDYIYNHSPSKDEVRWLYPISDIRIQRPIMTYSGYDIKIHLGAENKILIKPTNDAHNDIHVGIYSSKYNN